ncbi:MAG: tRNA lysidine(34) synthetase TilS [Planctomycetes bacterium]|nr:tRNA lysidine(34) synthetase TilS [Planctomycetota bacterium]
MPDRLEKAVAEFIRRQELFAGAGRILLAVSGGADSTALLHILAALRTQGQIAADLVCAHINHRLRGPASDADERFVLELANRLGLPVVTKAVEVRAYAQRHKRSLETAGRQLRLAGLNEIARDQGCTWIATGHQKNDNAETILHRLWRGTGFRGLAGIRPQREFHNLRLARPLLWATRIEIVEYLARRDLPWREDQTNADLTYTRNYIRHRLLPFLQKEAQAPRSMGVPPMSITGVPPVETGPGGPCDSRAEGPCDLVEELSELAASTARLYERIEREAEKAWARLVEPQAGAIAIRACGLAELSELVAVELIRQTVASLATGGGNLTEFHYRAILELTRGDAGGKELSLPNGLVVRREEERIALYATRPARTGRVGLAPPDSVPTALPIPGRIRWGGHDIEAQILPRSEIETMGLPCHTRADMLKGGKGPFTEYLDLDQVQPPVVVRDREPGDRFQPLGMGDEKKVGKFLTTAKVSRDLRERVLLFTDRVRILWVCPVRISEPVKVTERTRRVLQLTVRRAETP